MFIHGIGVSGPGFSGWQEASDIFLKNLPYYQEELPDPAPTILPPNELRRSSEVVRWSVQVAYEALQQAQCKAHEVMTVFATSGGETAILHQLCLALASQERIISPTLFHHSVHNAAAGYWSIGTGSHQPSVSLSCYDFSFCGGLLEAGTVIHVEKLPVLLIVYDFAPPQPLFTARPLVAPFATAFLISSQQLPHSLAHFSVQMFEGLGEETEMDDPSLESLRNGNPAARALPLLSAIAKGKQTSICINYLDDHQLQIGVTPCQPYLN